MRVPVLAVMAGLATSACGRDPPPTPPTDSSGTTSSGPTILYAFFDGANIASERSAGVLPCDARVPGTSCQLAPGQYEIVFDRDVSACIYSATSASTDFRALSALPRAGGKPNAVSVNAFDKDGVLSASPFYLTIIC